MRRLRGRKRPAGQRLRRGIYLIPSLFTVANIFCGFLSIVQSSRGRMGWAALLILIAGVADMLDGRIARLTGTTSSFGAAYDSLADVVSFGAAPALLAYQWGLWQVPRVGMATAFLFLVAGSIRLARFNTTVHDSRTFQGLPIPAGAGGVAMLVLISPAPVSHEYMVPVVVVFVLGLSLLMVSNLPYRTFKDFNLRRQWPAPTLFAIAVIFSLITVSAKVLAVLLAIYILSAPFAVITRRSRSIPAVTPKSESEPQITEKEHDVPG